MPSSPLQVTIAVVGTENKADVTCLITGASLFAYLESLPEKVVVVISADLAHTHLASGPYGYSNASEPFDKVRGSLVASPQG